MLKSTFKFFDQSTPATIDLTMSESCRPCGEVVQKLASMQGTPDIYCWYEGTRWGKSLPILGVEFMTENLFKPLYQAKQDITLCLYSLKAWGFNNYRDTSDLVSAIASLNSPVVRGVNSSSFFLFCLEQTSGRFYDLIQWLLPKKKYLFDLSADREPIGKTVGNFLDNQPSLLDCVRDYDVKEVYSILQYIEAYYLIRDSVQNQLNRRNRIIEIVFLLPDDENKYYLGLNEDISDMLHTDFGRRIDDCTINISFQCFEYDLDISRRPYMGSSKGAKFISPAKLGPYFTFLNNPLIPDNEDSSSLPNIPTGGM